MKVYNKLKHHTLSITKKLITTYGFVLSLYLLMGRGKVRVDEDYYITE